MGWQPIFRLIILSEVIDAVDFMMDNPDADRFRNYGFYQRDLISRPAVLLWVIPVSAPPMRPDAEKIILRARAEIEEKKNGQVPYCSNRTALYGK